MQTVMKVEEAAVCKDRDSWYSVIFSAYPYGEPGAITNLYLTPVSLLTISSHSKSTLAFVIFLSIQMNTFAVTKYLKISSTFSGSCNGVTFPSQPLAPRKRHRPPSNLLSPFRTCSTPEHEWFATQTTLLEINTSFHSPYEILQYRIRPVSREPGISNIFIPFVFHIIPSF